MNCLFCDMVAGNVPIYKLYEDDFCIVILDAFPTVDGHTLIIPKKHYEDVTELDEEIVLHMYHVAKKLSKSLMEKLEVTSLSMAVNYGDAQKIKHFHLHLLPNLDKHKKPKMKPEEMYVFLTSKKSA